MDKKFSDSKVDFDKRGVLGCSDIEQVKVAAIQTMDACIILQDFLIGRIDSMKNLMSAENMDILRTLQVSTKGMRMLQLAKMFKDHKDPLVILDSMGNMLAVDIDSNNNLAQAVKPDWLNDITLFKKGTTWAHGNTQRHNAIDRNTFRRKARFQYQAQRDEEHFSKVQLHKNKTRRVDE